MGEAYWAAREGDILLHTSMLADIVGAAVELACTAGLIFAASLIPAAGILLVLINVGAMLAADCIGSAVGDWVSGLFPPAEDGVITTGSHNTRTNSKFSARAAGILQTENTPQSNEEPEQSQNFSDIPQNILTGIGAAVKESAKEFIRPTIAAPEQPVTPQIEDTITCAKHPSPVSSPEYLAEGSKKVYINSQPAVRSNDRSTCEAKVTEDCEKSKKVSNNVRIGGESVVVREIRSGKHPIAQTIGLVGLLFNRKKLCNSISCFLTNLVGNAAKAYIASKVTETAVTISTNLVKAVFSGNPIHLPTGAKLLFGPEELDFSLPAHLPFEWQRFYSSVDTRTHNMFGAGWSVGYETEMEIDPQPDGSCAAVFTDEQGRRLEIEPMQPGENMRGLNENLSIYRGGQDRWVIEDDDGLYRLFEPDPNNPKRLLLSMLQDRNDNQLLIYRDSHSRIVEIADNDNAARISLHYQDQRHPQRVTEIRQELSDGSSRLLNRYQYTEQGDLQQVFDAENRQTREFAYNSDRRMTYHRLPTGLQCYYQWSYFSTADVETAWRVTRHWSEADGQRLEDYHFHYDPEKRLTTVEDS
ncbi:DUF6531 domain-containing protein, partial [Snodgrassella alvi]|uniref:DUF6531 domain-containing protein n=3 Tax=Snodgrassella alvi TaxID=1196083 RepID=UPI0018E135F4